MKKYGGYTSEEAPGVLSDYRMERGSGGGIWGTEEYRELLFYNNIRVTYKQANNKAENALGYAANC